MFTSLKRIGALGAALSVTVLGAAAPAAFARHGADDGAGHHRHTHVEHRHGADDGAHHR